MVGRLCSAVTMAEEIAQLDTKGGQGDSADCVSGLWALIGEVKNKGDGVQASEVQEGNGETGGERCHGPEVDEAAPSACGEMALDGGAGETFELGDPNPAELAAEDIPPVSSRDAAPGEGSSLGADGLKPRRELEASNCHPDAPPKKDRKTASDREHYGSTAEMQRVSSGDAALGPGISPGAELGVPRMELKAPHSHPEAPRKRDRRTASDSANYLPTEVPTDVEAAGRAAESFETPSRASGGRSRVRQ
ncbi:hypothetical protein N9L19_00715, partial [bacterium]|nr:hypothetical protein [bacterium]